MCQDNKYKETVFRYAPCNRRLCGWKCLAIFSSQFNRKKRIHKKRDMKSIVSTKSRNGNKNIIQNEILKQQPKETQNQRNESERPIRLRPPLHRKCRGNSNRETVIGNPEMLFVCTSIGQDTPSRLSVNMDSSDITSHFRT